MKIRDILIAADGPQDAINKAGIRVGDSFTVVELVVQASSIAGHWRIEPGMVPAHQNPLADRLRQIKRHNIEACCVPGDFPYGDVTEDPRGEWVRAADVQAIVDELKQ